MISDIMEAQIEISCKELRLPGIRQQFRALIEKLLIRKWITPLSQSMFRARTA